MVKTTRLILSIAMAGAGVFSVTGGGTVVAAQAPNPCALLTASDVQSLAPKSSVGDGVANSLPALGSMSCRYTSGAGVNRLIVNIVVTDEARMFPGMSPDQIKQRLTGSVRAGTTDAVIADVGQAAIFKADSPYISRATASLKGRIVEVQVDGLVAREKRDAIISLLKSAISKL